MSTPLTPATSSSASTSDSLVLVAALGPSTNRSRVGAQLLRHFAGWDCIAVSFDANSATHADYLASRCALRVHAALKWASLVNATRAEIARADYARVMLLLDDVVFARDFNASRLVALGARHGLGVVSPRIDHATVPVMRYHRRASADEVVRMSALETYATLFATRAAWNCFASLLDDAALHDAANAVGWGYDRCYGPVCDAATGGQALVPGEAAAHCGQRGGLVHRYHLGALANAQKDRLSAWVRKRTGRPCATYNILSRAGARWSAENRTAHIVPCHS